MSLHKEKPPFANSLETLSYELIESFKKQIKKLENQCQKYLNEINELSKKLVEADEIVKDEILCKEKTKQFLSETRIENSNLILINRNLRQQLLNFGAKVEENEKIIRKLSLEEGKKEKIDFTNQVNYFDEQIKEKEIRRNESIAKEKSNTKKEKNISGLKITILDIEYLGTIKALPKLKVQRAVSVQTIEFQPIQNIERLVNKKNTKKELNKKELFKIEFINHLYVPSTKAKDIKENKTRPLYISINQIFSYYPIKKYLSINIIQHLSIKKTILLAAPKKMVIKR